MFQKDTQWSWQKATQLKVVLHELLIMRQQLKITLNKVA